MGVLAQVVPRGGGVSILVDIQKLSGDGPGQPSLSDTALAFGVGPDDLQKCLQTIL